MNMVFDRNSLDNLYTTLPPTLLSLKPFVLRFSFSAFSLLHSVLHFSCWTSSFFTPLLILGTTSVTVNTVSTDQACLENSAETDALFIIIVLF